MRLSSAGDPMIYRSRYLDRMLFSPLGYRQEQRPQPSSRPLRHEAREVHELQGGAAAGVPLRTPVFTPLQQPQAAGSQGQQPVPLSERATYFSSRELREVVNRCEKVIVSGQAQIEDYEAFVICQQELGSRV